MWSAAVLLPALPGRTTCDGLAAAASPVVDEAHQWMVPEGLFAGRSGVLLLWNASAQPPGPGPRSPVRLHPAPRDQPTSAPFNDLSLARSGSSPGPPVRSRPGVDQSRDRWTRGHRPEHARPRSQHPDIGQGVPADTNREGHIHQDLPRIMHRPLLPPRRQGRRYHLAQPGHKDLLNQQHATGLAGHRTTGALNADTRIRPESAGPAHTRCRRNGQGGRADGHLQGRSIKILQVRASRCSVGAVPEMGRLERRR